MPGRRGGDKKRQWISRPDEEEEVVDDLAHAATFAMMTPMMPTSSDPTDRSVGARQPGNAGVPENLVSIVNTTTDDDNIELESSSDDQGSDEESTAGKEKKDDDDDDDDDQSDFDLNEALAKMDPDEASLDDDDEDNEDGNGHGDDEKNATKKGSKTRMMRAPKTENEVDAYRTPIHELEQHMRFQLSVAPSSTDGSQDDLFRRLTASNLKLAGHVKHYMAFDRTVVVESSALNPHGERTGKFWGDNAPLDEGSLLVFRPSTSIETDNNNQNNNGDIIVEHLVPLGRVFEVFGPVSQPLYTIRLPSKLVAPKIQLPKKAPPKKLDPDKVERTDVATEQSESEQTSNGQGNIEVEAALVRHAVEVLKDKLSGEASGYDPETGNEIVPLVPPQNEGDPWAPDGKYAKLLQQRTPLEVYYVIDEAKMIDAGLIMKASRKGCDASNLYDEEVIDANEMYFSDDEKEHQAKQRRKSRGKQNAANGASDGTQLSGSSYSRPRVLLPSGFHSAHVPLPSGFHSAHVPSPSGFHSAQPVSNSTAPTQPVAAYPQGFHYPIPPPSTMRPPMPSAQRMSYPYSSILNGKSMGGSPPPPPPPGSSAPPPAYEY